AFSSARTRGLASTKSKARRMPEGFPEENRTKTGCTKVEPVNPHAFCVKITHRSNFTDPPSGGPNGEPPAQPSCPPPQHAVGGVPAQARISDRNTISQLGQPFRERLIPF